MCVYNLNTFIKLHWLAMNKKYFLLLSMIVTSLCHAAGSTPHWSYEGQENPANWGKISPDFSLCESGKNQSPVNIQGAMKTHISPLNIAFGASKQEVVNNGHTIQVNVTDGNTLLLDKDTYTLQQFHFHTPSEHLIDGKQFPLEAHFVYKNKEGALAVIALHFKEGKTNQQLEHIWQQMPKEHNQQAVLNNPVNIRSLLPEKLDFYRLSGSLTTPPCSEGVRWLLLKQTVDVSSSQIAQFKTVIPSANNRPIQPLNGRVIIQ